MLDRILIGSSAEPSDPNFKNVTLLLHGDGSNGAQNNTFLDSSTNNFTITRNGNTTQGSFSPYGSNWSNYFDGSGDYLNYSSSSTLNFGTGDFTVECWIYLNNTTGSKVIIGGAASNSFGFRYGTSFGVNGGLSIYREGVADLDYTSYAFAANTWYHVAVVRQSGVIKYFVNGTQQTTSGSGGGAYNFPSETTVSVGRGGAGGEEYGGYISNVRVVKGTAVYTSNFTPSTTPLTAVTNTSLLTCAYNRFRDGSTNNFTITGNGGVKVTNFAPFAPSAAYSTTADGGSAYFDGTGDYLTGSSPMIPATSTSTFTIEGWVYPTTFANRIDVIGDMSPTSASDVKVIAAEVNTSGQVALYWFDGAVRRCTGNTAMVLNQWNYFAIVVNSNAIAIYVNKTTADTLSGTTTLANRTQTHNFALGAYYTSATYNGYLSNIRVSTVARTISSVPSSPVSSDANTRLLINATNAAIFDNSMKNDLETVGNAQISTSVKKFGTGSMAFDGSGDYLKGPNSDAFSFGTGDYTIELWMNTNADNGNVIDFRVGGNLTAYPAIYLSGGGAYFWTGTGSDGVSVGSYTKNAWVHLAVSRSGSSLKFFINGTQTYSASDTTNLSQGTVVIGARWDAASAFAGYIDDFRITKGVARYTANFTPPTAAFANK